MPISVKTFLPGFRGTCLIVGILNITFFLMALSKGIMNMMEGFNVPPSTIQSPHYSDAMFWVFLHMSIIGVMVILIGLAVDDPTKQLLISSILMVVFSIYLFLDISNSDNPFGSALYKGSQSLFPVFVDCFYILLFARMTFILGRRPSVKQL